MAFFQFFGGLGVGLVLSILLMFSVFSFSMIWNSLKDGSKLPEMVGTIVGALVFGGFNAGTFIFLAKIALESFYMTAGALVVLSFFLYTGRNSK